VKIEAPPDFADEGWRNLKLVRADWAMTAMRFKQNIEVELQRNGDALPTDIPPSMMQVMTSQQRQEAVCLPISETSVNRYNSSNSNSNINNDSGSFRNGSLNYWKVRKL
ncbi:hypothetical protein BGZ58_002891, partial [Dissophora ornata]